MGKVLIEAALNTLSTLPLACTTISVHHDTNFDALINEVEAIIANSESQGGLLILTDLYGSTPCNIAKKLSAHATCEVVTGLNLAMLIRIMNYASLPLDALAEKACEGGKQSIQKIKKENHD